MTDIVGLPEPVQLALKVIRLEGELQDQDSKVKSLEDTIADLKNEMHKTKEENEFELAKQTREVKFLTEKLDYKTNLDAKMKEIKQKDEKTEIEELKEEVTNLADVKEEVSLNDHISSELITALHCKVLLSLNINSFRTVL